ncbi:unnamed protein product [Durusdinium trenchii]|uniref:Sfi1 spindle body domain-containing protein n=1 Tax=Durusdinium trenchii TaxID=1381693 RepID=A0ABP0L5D7_9DINO
MPKANGTKIERPLQGAFRAASLSAAARRQNEAFATNFSMAGASCEGRPGASHLPKLREMTPPEVIKVEQISERLAEVKRSYHAFGEEPEEEPQKAPMKSRRRSDMASCEMDERTQRLALRQFEEIDAGRLDPQSVFSRISGADKRVKVKLHYFRDRSDLVLPVIEDRYIMHDPKRDCFLVDLSLLQSECSSLSARTPRKHVSSTGRLDEDDMSFVPEADHVGASHAQAVELSVEPSSHQAVSRFDSQRTRPSERSVQTAEQRALRLIRAARIRDERISICQHNVRNAELEWRLNHLQMSQQRDRRKQLASAQRILFSWVVVASATQFMQTELLKSRWLKAARSHNFGDHYATRSRAHWQRAKNLVHKSVLESSKNMRDFRKVLHLRATRSKAAWQRWDHLMRIIKFITRLRVRFKFNRYADAIKQFIESSWRGMRFRSKVGVYLANVRVLQRAVRAAHRFRQNVKLYIFAPTLWELETQLLGQKLKAHLPKDYTKQKVQQHRQAWDWEGRVRALQEMSKERKIKGVKGPMDETRRQNMLAKAKARSGERRRRGGVRIGMYNERHVIFSELGEAISGTAADRKQQQAWKVANNVLDHYRLDAETRKSVVKNSFHHALERWKIAHVAFKKEQKRLNVLWQQWRLEIQALGKMQKEHWPKPPPYVEPPTELFKVDTKKLG